MKNEDVRLGKHINMYMWQNGNRNPPHKIEVVADVIKDKDYEYVIAELKGKSLEDLKPKVVEKKKEGLAGKLEGMVGTDKKKVEKKKPGKVTEKQAVETEKKEVEKKVAEKVETKKEEVAKLEKKEKVSTAKVEEKEVKQEQKVERAEKSTPIKK
jgi:hypothetical protein